MQNIEKQTIRGGGALSIDIKTAKIKIKQYFHFRPNLFDPYHKSALAAFVLVNYFPFSHNEVAQALGIKPSTLHNRLWVISSKIKQNPRFQKAVDEIYNYIIYNASLIYGRTIN